jgi:hypothetical protein
MLFGCEEMRIILCYTCCGYLLFIVYICGIQCELFLSIMSVDVSYLMRCL